MTIATMDDLTASLKQRLRIYTPSLTAKAAGAWHSLWRAASEYGAGGIPATGSGEVCSLATTGAMVFQNPTAPALSYVGRLHAQMATIGTLVLYDRLVTTSGLVGNIATEQTVNSVGLTRYTSGVGLELFIETYVDTGATAANLTVSYTDQDNIAGKTAVIANQVSAVVGQLQRVPLPTAGIKSVQSVTLSASTGTAGDFGITLAKPLVEIPVVIADTGVILSPFETGLEQIIDSACLAMMVKCSATNTGIISGSLGIFQG